MTFDEPAFEPKLRLYSGHVISARWLTDVRCRIDSVSDNCTFKQIIFEP